MEYMNAEGPSFIPYSPLITKSSNQSPVHLSGKETWMIKDNKVIYSSNGLNSSLHEANIQFHSLKRAIFTIVLPCTQILVVNSAACKLLNYSSDELITMKLQNLLQDHYKHKLMTMSDHYLNESSRMGNKKEKLVELVSKDGDVIPASIFFKKIDSPHRCLAVVEPIDRKTAVVTVDNSGKIVTCDEEATAIFQYDSSELVGTSIRTIIPSISLDPDGEDGCEISYKQRLTGKNRQGTSFPLCLVINRTSQGIWRIVIWVFLNLSGLIILNKELRITNCNYQFTKLLFGSTRDNVLNQKMTKFIPSFSEDIKAMSGQRDVSSHNENSDASSRSESKKYRLSAVNLPIGREKIGKQACHRSFVDFPVARKSGRLDCFLTDTDHCRSWKKCTCKKILSKASNLNIRLSKSDCDIRLERESKCCSTDDKSISSQEIPLDSDEYQDRRKFNSEEFTVREKQKKGDCYFDYKHFGLKEEYFSGIGKHWDGNDIDIYYKVKIITFGDKVFYCVWISRDPWEINDVSPNMPTTVTGSSSIISASIDDSMTKDSSCNDELTRLSSISVLSQNDEILTGGEYSENYTNIKQIGKGAFGYVKMAFRHSDGLLVVTKFIKKHKINVQSWVFDAKWTIKIPLEISLLTSLKHPNIIEVLDVFHNDSFFQLVMKKHGAGMDLFEFIERKPASDEKLNSYIFRQIISAVEYLDSIGVLHRDIKDENIIINEKFEVKLIDFGSAAFRRPGKLFSVFYGTVEYCSPEVLQGNRYRGPELEIWALGVTLYVLTFGKNPFYDVQETIKGDFSIPAPISSYLYDLLHEMLDREVDSRITIGRVATHPWITQPVDIDKYRFEDVVHCSVAEADPPRYVTTFTFDRRHAHDQTLDADGDRTMTSSNSFCSLQTTEITENFDENLQDLDGDFLTNDSVFKTSTPVGTGTSKNRGDITKSAGALNRVCDGSATFRSQICDRCKCQNYVKKRFSLDINILKRLSGSSKCSESDCSFEQVGASDSRSDFYENLELELISDVEEMKLVPNASDGKYLYDSDSCCTDQAYPCRDRTISRETEESNLTVYPEFYDTSDSRSFDGEDSDYFCDADNEKFKDADEY